jgi:hypothetical protein
MFFEMEFYMTQEKKEENDVINFTKDAWIAVIAGGLGIISAMVTAIFGYLGTTAPIRATQMAEKGQYLENATSDVLRITEVGAESLCYNRILPVITNPRGNYNEVSQYIDGAINDGSYFTWSYGPNTKPGIPHLYLMYILTNVVESSTEWVIVENSIELSFERQDIPLDLDVKPGSCGGAGFDRVFSPVFLESTNTANPVISNIADYDYFNLKPGESERFILPVYCEEPGIYSLNVNFLYTYKGKSSVFNYTGDINIGCPYTFTLWYTNPEQYRFENGVYVLVP